MNLFQKHENLLRDGLAAAASRTYFSPFQESPSSKYHPEGAKASGEANFERYLGEDFPTTQSDGEFVTADERSPFTMEPLNISYPHFSASLLLERAEKQLATWGKVRPEERVGICLEILNRLAESTFLNAFATMHTSGQAFMMAFAGSGANSLDRGLEGILFAHQAMAQVPESATYTRNFGRHLDVVIEKRFNLVPRGVATVVTCGSYPAWNAYPALFANLATGNPVVLKPHPRAILPMAIAVEVARNVLLENGYDPDVVQLAPDTAADPIAKEIVDDDRVAIIDFTGGQEFGRWLERTYAHKLVYTETAGCNAVILESTNDLDATLFSVAHGLSLFSSQMCTAPQNIFVPKEGVRTPDGIVDLEEIETRLAASIDRLVSKHGEAVCGAVFDDATRMRVKDLESDGDVIRASGVWSSEQFPNPRSVTPLLLRANADSELYRREQFGPVGFVISCEDRNHALVRATEDAKIHGSIASYAYSTDDDFLREICDAFLNAGANVGCNLHKHLPINFTAAFSDYHVTGLNPAGNACLTDAAFVANRFRIVQSKIEQS